MSKNYATHPEQAEIGLSHSFDILSKQTSKDVDSDIINLTEFEKSLIESEDDDEQITYCLGDVVKL